METFFISLFIIVFSAALSMIGYTLYQMSKKMPTSSSDDKEDLLNERAGNIAVEAAKKALDEVLKQNAELQKKDWDGYKKDLDLTLTPVKKSLEDLQKNISEVERDRVEDKGKLDEKLKDLIGTTDSLSRALTSSSDTGDLGETILRNLVEKAGMIKYIDFVEQTSTGNRSIPDMVINLPGGGKIPIDSKLSLESFDRAMDTADKSERKALEVKHANNCRTLMRNLSKQEYYKQFDGPIEFVVMFIGSEPAYQMALKHDGKLFLDGADKKVFVVSPLSLLPLLSLVSEAWRQFQLSTNANQAIQIAKDLTDRLKIYEEKYQAVGARILSLGKAYNSSVSSYNARLKPSVRNLQKLQGQPQDLMEMENVPVDVTPVIESLEADNEEE
jgi:DNA recombination protein RmuC